MIVFGWSKCVASKMWTTISFVLTCNVDGYGESSTCLTLRYFMLPIFGEVVIGLKYIDSSWEIICACDK